MCSKDDQDSEIARRAAAMTKAALAADKADGAPTEPATEGTDVRISVC